jgi:hypothetical protein
MSFKSWLRYVKSLMSNTRAVHGRAERGRRKPASHRPAFESLEDRLVLTGAANDHTVLILGTTVTGGSSSQEAQAAIRRGYDVEVADNNAWLAKSQSDFATYRALIIGDPTCTGDQGVLSAAVNSESKWGPVVNGNVIINGTDPVYHSYLAGPRTLTDNSVGFAVDGGAGKTGMYISLSCEYNSAPDSGQVVPLLDAFSPTPGTFKVREVSCYNNVHIVATHPALTGLTDAALSGWSCSVHEAFTSWAPDFSVLAIAKDLGSSYTATDGTVGTPYILARGAGLSVISDVQLDPATATVSLGSSITLTATVTTSSPSAGTPVAGATATFSVIAGPDAGVTGTGVTDSAGHATFNLTGSSLGTDYVVAKYTDSRGVTQTSGTSTIEWISPATTTVVDSSLNPSTYGQLVTFTATVSTAGGPMAVGSVEFLLDGSTSLRTEVVDDGEASISVSTLTAGTHTITANFIPSASLLTASSGSVIQTVNQADASITVNGYSGVYDGNAHGATGSASGVGGVDLTSLLHLGNSFTDVPGGTAHWTFDGNTNYKSASGDVAIVITQATPTVSVTGGSFTYDGLAHPATGSVIGVNGANLGTPTFTYSYTDDSGHVVTTTAAPVDPGYYTVTASFAGDANYNAASATATITIAFEVRTLTDLSKAFHAGRTIPIKLQLIDAAGNNVSSSSIDLTALRLERVNADGTTTQVTLQDSGNANPGNLFRYDAALGGYIFNLSTKGLTAGTYDFFWTAEGDPTVHELSFQLI